MANEPTTTITGNLVADVDLKYTAQGAAVASFTVASTPRTFDKASGEYKDGQVLYMRCSLWRQPAEHATESLSKGDRVIVTGRLRQRSFETREGEKRSVIELDVDEIGPSLRYATATVKKTERGSEKPAGQRSDDPFSTAPAADDEAPF